MKKLTFLLVMAVVVVGLVGLWTFKAHSQAPPKVQGYVKHNGQPAAYYTVMCFQKPSLEWKWNVTADNNGYWYYNGDDIESGVTYRFWGCNGTWKGYRDYQYQGGSGEWVEDINADNSGLCPGINK